MPYILTAKNVIFKNSIRYPLIQIASQKTTFIQGESGCGKSTLLRLFNATICPSAGQILFAAQDIQSLDTTDLRKQILLVSQQVFLFNQSIKENFITYYTYRTLPVPNEQTMKTFLRICCIDIPLDTLCTTLSGGERQRVSLAIFLSFTPTVLMLDEPTSALDTQNATTLIGNIKTFCTNHNITLIVVSHDTTLSTQFADARIILKGESS